eukprot:g24699.t1
MSYDLLKYNISALLSGVVDSLKFHIPPLFFLTSKTVRERMVQCLVLNGIIFLGSILLVEYILLPLLTRMMAVSDAGGAELILSRTSLFMDLLFDWLYLALWIWPMYGISLVLCSIWYQEIAEAAYITRGGKRNSSKFTFKRWVNAMAEELYKWLFVGSFIIGQTTLFTAIPRVGWLLGLLHLCWLYSFYSFDYLWNLQGIAFEDRCQYFQERWAYFTGFGFPSALLTYLLPRFIGAGIFALLFPFFIILAIVAQPDARGPPPKNNVALPIFRISKKINLVVLEIIDHPPSSQYTFMLQGRRLPNHHNPDCQSVYSLAQGIIVLIQRTCD